jgi:hypothetical protein
VNEETLKEMLEAYSDGGVSRTQSDAFGSQRPEIATFLNFCSKHQGVPFRALWNFGGLEFIFAYREQFREIGIEGAILAECMDGDSVAIGEVCRKILQSLENAKELSRTDKTHMVSRGLTVNLTAVKAFILATLDAKERYHVDEVIPEFHFLISWVLFPGPPDADALRTSQNLKFNATFLAWGYRHKYNIYPSYRKLAKVLGVAPSTISRLFSSRDEFEANVEMHGVMGEPNDFPRLARIMSNL